MSLCYKYAFAKILKWFCFELFTQYLRITNSKIVMSMLSPCISAMLTPPNVYAREYGLKVKYLFPSFLFYKIVL